MSEEEQFEIQIRETRDLVRRMDRQIDLVERLLAESKASIRGVQRDFTNSIGMELVWCQPGTFWMGSPEDEEGRGVKEALHEVTLTRGFWIGRFPVTQGQWEEVMGGNPSHFTESGPEAPVEMVNWTDSVEFCRTLSQREAREYRLPSEAEWEYACRAGSAGAWCFRNDQQELGDYAWYQNNSTGRTHSVGRKQPNAWGIHDMHGNVWEWCRDWRGDYPSGPVADPLGPKVGSFRVDRGGGWGSFDGHCRSAARSGSRPDYRFFGLGFRIAVSSSF